MEKIERILEFWFNKLDDDTVIASDDESIRRWFKKDEEFHAMIKNADIEGGLFVFP